MTAGRVVGRGLLALAAGGAVAATVASPTLLSLLAQASIQAVFAVGLGLLLRQNGMVSFGHAVFFGAAGYGVGALLQASSLGSEAAVVIAVAAVTALAVLLGLVVVRVPGIAFGMLTLAVGQMFYLTASRARGFTGGADGMNIEWRTTFFGAPIAAFHDPALIFALCWAVLVFVVTALTLLLGGRFGDITAAVRDNEERARFIGIRTLLPRAAVYALSAFVSALAGVLSILNTGFVSPESLHWSASGVTLMMVIVGGTRWLWGPALGAFVYFLVKDALGDHATHWMAIFGIALIVVTVFVPEGLGGLLLRPWHRRRAPERTASDRVPAGATAVEAAK